MVVIALLAGSVLGFFVAVSCWLFIGLTVPAAAALYVGTALGLGLLPVAICATR